MLSAGEDGNLYIAAYAKVSSTDPQTTTLFSSAEGIVSSDYQNRMFVYFPTSMARYNASRLRLVDDPYIPRGSQVVTLTPLQIGDNAIYVAMDTQGKGYQLCWCTMQGASPKLFVVGDPDVGPANLMEELRWSVTGGIMGIVRSWR